MYKICQIYIAFYKSYSMYLQPLALQSGHALQSGVPHAKTALRGGRHAED